MPEVKARQLTLDSQSVGPEFIEAIEAVAKIREQRAAQYRDEYLNDDYLFLCYQVQNKIKRFKLQMNVDSGNESISNKEVALDSAIDAANYAIFMVAKLLRDNHTK
jgi:hypothetical protein